MKNISRRDFIAVGGITTGGLIANHRILGAEYLKKADKNAVLTRSKQLNERLKRSKDYLSDIELPLSDNIEAYRYNRSKNLEGPNITDKGLHLTPNFYLSTYSGDALQGRVETRSYDYHYLEGVDYESITAESISQLLDLTGDGFKDIVLAGSEETGDLGRLNNHLEEFNQVRPFIRVEDNAPFISQKSLEELRDIENQISKSLNDFTDFLKSYEGSPAQISESSSDLITELRRSERSTYRSFPLIDFTTGSYHPEDNFTQTEAENLINGEGKYEEFGLEQTKETADQLIIDSAIQAGKAAVLQHLVSSTIAFSEENTGLYDSPQEVQEDEFDDILTETELYRNCGSNIGRMEKIENYAIENGLKTKDLEYYVEPAGDKSVLKYGVDLEKDYKQVFIENCR